MSTPELFFVTGLPKGGTTWMMRMLNSLPGVRCLGEGRFFASNIDGVPPLYEALETGLRPWYEYQAHRKNNVVRLDPYIETINKYNYLPGDVLHESFTADLEAVVRAAVQHFMLKGVTGDSGLQFVGEKTPIVYPHELHRLRKVFPTNKVIWLRRDVKDFIVSLVFGYWRQRRNARPAKISFLNVDDFLQVERFVQATSQGQQPEESVVSKETALKLARIWLVANTEAEQIAAQQPEELLIVQYEKLLRTPHETMRDVVDFLGADLADEAIAESIRQTDRQAVKKSGNEALKSHVRSGEPGDWVHYLNAEVSAAIDQVLFVNAGGQD